MKVEEMRIMIAQAMKESGITQRDLGISMGVNSRTIRKWLTGRCRFDQYVDMCSKLGLSVYVCDASNEVVITGHFIMTNRKGKV